MDFGQPLSERPGDDALLQHLEAFVVFTTNWIPQKKGEKKENKNRDRSSKLVKESCFGG